MAKKIPIKHLQKITTNIKKSILEENIDDFKKWCQIIYKHKLEKTFMPVFQESAILLMRESAQFNAQFFDYFISESKIFNYKNEELIKKSIIYSNHKCYQILKNQQNFYKSTFFDKTCFKIYYTHSFEEDFSKVLEMSTLKNIEDYAYNLHLNMGNNINLTKKIFQTLDFDKRKNYYLENLFKIVMHEKNEIIEGFFNLVISEISVDIISDYFLQKNKTSATNLEINNSKQSIGYELFIDLISTHQLKLKLDQDLFKSPQNGAIFKKIKI